MDADCRFQSHSLLHLVASIHLVGSKPRFLLTAKLGHLPRRLALGIFVILENGFEVHPQAGNPFVLNMQDKNTIPAGVIVPFLQKERSLLQAAAEAACNP